MRRHVLTDTTLREFGNQARDRFEDIQNQGAKFSRDTAQSVDTYVHKEPWKMLGIFSLVFGLFGFFFGRSGRSYRRK